MSFWRKWRQDRARKRALRHWVLAVHDHLVDHLLSLTRDGAMGHEDEYEIRFEIMVFLASYLLFKFKGDPEFSQAFWEVVFEGFQESLRSRGVTDVRMGARMNQTFQEATGRRNAYLSAWEAADQETLRRAIGRNVLNGARSEDTRIDTLLASLVGLTDRVEGYRVSGQKAGQES